MKLNAFSDEYPLSQMNYSQTIFNFYDFKEKDEKKKFLNVSRSITFCF